MSVFHRIRFENILNGETGSQNDGVGGNITVGCVVYEYKTLDQRVHGSRRSQVESPEHKTYDAQGVYDRSPEVMTYR